MDSFPLRALSTSWLAKHVKSAMRMVESIHRVPQSRASPWVTEFASTYASGAPGSDTFASSLWYADALGSMAQSGYRMACRQTLVGGHYSLTRWGPGGALQPNPDFFVALLWRRLMGARVLQVRGSFWVERLRGHVHSARECAHYSSLVGHPQCKHLIRKGMLALPLPQWVRAYAHCTYSGPPGSVAITLINLNLSHASRVAVVNLPGETLQLKAVQGAKLLHGPRHEYDLWAISVVSTQVQLGDFGTLRDAAQVRPTVREAGTPLIVRPCSIKFVVLPEARLPQCM